MSNKTKTNYIEITGTVTKEPEFAFESGLAEARYNMYEATVAAKRMSGYSDEIKAVMPEAVASRLVKGERVTLVGNIRTYNKYNEELGRNETKIFIYVKNSYPASSDEDTNTVKVVGTVCKQPILRQTPYEKTICDIILAVNTTRHHSDYIPTICWGRNAVQASKLEIGSKVVIEGRMQSREYTKVINDVEVKKTAYELSCNSIKDFIEDEDDTEEITD